MRAAREQCDEVDRLAVRQPGPVRRAGRPRRATRAREASDAAIAARARRRRAVRPAASRRSTRDGFATTVRVGGLADVLEGAERGARPLRRRLHGRLQAVQHRRARRRVLRPEGRPAGRRRPPHGARPRPARAARGGRRPCASPTGWRSPRATPASVPPTARARSRCAAGWTRSGTPSRGGERDPAAAAAAGRAAMAAHGVRARIPRRRRSGHAGAGGADRRAGTSGRRGPRRAGTADRQRPDRHRAGGDPRLRRASTTQRSKRCPPRPDPTSPTPRRAGRSRSPSSARCARWASRS